MVDPFPDAAAHDPLVGIEGFPVLLQASGTIAHCMGIFAEDVGHLAILLGREGIQLLLGLSDLAHMPRIGIHLAVHIRHGQLIVAFIVDGAGRIGFLCPAGHRLVVAPNSRLVAQRPHDHAGVVLVALDHPLHAVHAGRFPLRIAGGVARPVLGVGPFTLFVQGRAGLAESMRLQVALIDDVKPIPIAQIKPARIVRIVAAAHCIHVVGLHQQDVANHRLHRHRPAEIRMMLVSIHALHLDRHAVYSEHAVDDFDFSEAGLLRDDFDAVASGILQCHERRVEIRRLGRPLVGLLHGHGDLDDNFLASRHTQCLAAVGGGFAAGRVEQGDGELIVLHCLLRQVLDFRLHLQRGTGEFGVELRSDPDIADLHLGHCQQIDIAEDSAEPPHVLVFHVGAIRPLHHLDGDGVAAGPDAIGDIELGRDAAALGEADLFTIDPEIKGGIDTLEADKDLFAIPSLVDPEIAAVAASWVFGGDAGWIDRERVLDVRVVRMAVALELPVARDGDVCPRRDVECLLKEALGYLGHGGGVMELPLAIEAGEPGSVAAIAADGRGFVRIGEEVCAGSKPVKVRNLRVFPIKHRHDKNVSCKALSADSAERLEHDSAVPSKGHAFGSLLDEHPAGPYISASAESKQARRPPSSSGPGYLVLSQRTGVRLP